MAEAEKQEEGSWFGGLIFWLGLIVVVGVVCWYMAAASSRAVPQASYPPVTIKVPELAGETLPVSVNSPPDFRGAEFVEFEQFTDQYTPDERFVVQEIDKVSVVLLASEDCSECPVFTNLTLKEVGGNQQKIVRYDVDTEGTMTVYVGRGGFAVEWHVIKAAFYTFWIALGAAVVWGVLCFFGLGELAWFAIGD